MRARIASAVIGLPLVIAASWFGSPWLPILVTLVALLGYWEFHQLASRISAQPVLLLGATWTATLVISGELDERYTLATIVAGLLASLTWAVLKGQREGALVSWGVSVAGPLYLGLPLSFALMLRSLEQGREWLLLGVLTTFATDAAAYLVGRSLGRHRLAPAISPGKTWEGAVAGLVGGVATCLALTAFVPRFDALPVSLWQAALVGGALGGVAQVGDLAESFLKRAAEVKEAGWLIPGHGGLLDRLDSVVFTLVVMYYLAIWLA